MDDEWFIESAATRDAFEGGGRLREFDIFRFKMKGIPC